MTDLDIFCVEIASSSVGYFIIKQSAQQHIWRNLHVSNLRFSDNLPSFKTQGTNHHGVKFMHVLSRGLILMLACCCLLSDGQGNRPSTPHAERTELRRRLNQTLPNMAPYQVSTNGGSCLGLHKHAATPSMNLRFQGIHWTDPTQQPIKPLTRALYSTLLATHPA